MKRYFLILASFLTISFTMNSCRETTEDKTDDTELNDGMIEDQEDEMDDYNDDCGSSKTYKSLDKYDIFKSR